MPTFLLTGASGFIGSHLYKNLLEDGVSVASLPSQSGQGDITWHSRALGPAQLQKVDVLVHLAAIAHTRRAQEQSYFEFNRDATVRLAQVAIAAGVRRFVFVSSVKAAAYDSTLMLNDEAVEAMPEDAYGRSKREAEQQLQALFANSGSELVIARPTLVYGAGVKGSLASLLRLVRRGWLPDVHCVQTKETSRSLVAVHDVVTALRLLADAPDIAGQVFIIAGSRPYTFSQLVQAMYRSQGKTAPFTLGCRSLGALQACVALLARALPSRLGSINSTLAKVCEAECYSAARLAALGWAPAQTIDDALPAMFAAALPDELNTDT